MKVIKTLEELESFYSAPSTASLRKVTHKLSPAVRCWIAHSKFCMISTVGPDGTDCSPRGEDGPVVREFDEKTLLLPDWRGNNRLDSLRNIVQDGRISLAFLVSGSTTVMRVNGTAVVTDDLSIAQMFEQRHRNPVTVTVITIGEIYFQCAKALMRSNIWSGELPSDLPTMGDLLADATDDELGGEEFDTAWPDRANKTLW